MTLYDSVNDIKEMLFGKKGVEFDKLRSTILKEIENGTVRIPPQYMMMKITNYCNSDCVYCNHAKSKVQNEIKQEISLEGIRTIINEAVQMGIKAISISGGEPLVRKDVETIVKQISESNVVPVLLTNGYSLEERAETLYKNGLRYFIISLDSLDEKDYLAQRGINIGPVLDGIETIRKLMQKDKSVRLHITPVITAKNILQMPEMVEFYSKKGIPIQFSPYHRFIYNMQDELAEFEDNEVNDTIDKLIQMKKNGYLIANSVAFLQHFKAFMSENKILPDGYKCLAEYSAVYVDPYENVLPCWSGGFAAVGNLKNKTLADIWYGEKYMELRKQMVQCKCAGCWLLCTSELTIFINGEE